MVYNGYFMSTEYQYHYYICNEHSNRSVSYECKNQQSLEVSVRRLVDYEPDHYIVVKV